MPSNTNALHFLHLMQTKPALAVERWQCLQITLPCGLLRLQSCSVVVRGTRASEKAREARRSPEIQPHYQEEKKGIL